MIHPSAIIHPGTNIGNNVEIGPFTVIAENVTIGDGTRIGAHVVIKGPTAIGRQNRIFQFSSIGDDPQDKKYKAGQDSILTIGDRNTIREFCTINRGTGEGGGVTSIGNDNWIMAYVHIAHDCIVGDNNTFANNATLAGHVHIDDHVILGGFTGVHQFCSLGRHCFTAISSVVVKDIPPYILVSGNTAKPCGLNREGLKRYGMAQSGIDSLRKAYRVVYQDGLLLKDALGKLDELAAESAEVVIFADFIRSSSRGIIR